MMIYNEIENIIKHCESCDRKKVYETAATDGKRNVQSLRIENDKWKAKYNLSSLFCIIGYLSNK